MLNDIELYLGNDLVVGNLKKAVYEEELKELNDKYPINESQIAINKTYILKRQNVLEVGVFIRNSSKKNISLKQMGIVLRELKGDIIANKMEELKEQSNIPARSAVPLKIEFDLQTVNGYDESKEYVVEFYGVDSINTFRSKKIEIVDINDNLSFEDEEELIKFNKNLPDLKVNEFNINTFKIIQMQDNKLKVSLFFRNATAKTAIIEVLSIFLVDSDENVVSQALFDNLGEGIVVESGKGVFQDFILPCSVKLDSESIQNLSVRFK